MNYESEELTPYATICRGDRFAGFAGCGKVYMTKEAYLAQMMAPDYTWRCARCGGDADWDDDNYEVAMGEIEQWVQDAYDYADVQLNLGPQQCSLMEEMIMKVRPWEGDLEPWDWVDEWARNRHPEP